MGVWTETDIGDLRGRCALITGANSGIGFEAAKMFAAHGARVLLGCRDERRGDEAARSIRDAEPDADVEPIRLDLASLSSVRIAAAVVGVSEPRLDWLVNNAGVMAIARQETDDGFEAQFGINHLGHFALTGLLLPLLIDTPASRVVTVSSSLHIAGRLDPDNLMGERTYGRWRQYGLSKVANLLFTYELQHRLSKALTGTIAVACHPGYAATGHDRDSGWFARFGAPLARRVAQPVRAGAWPTMRAATDPMAMGGEYYGPAGRFGFSGPPVLARSNDYSHDEEVARRLWDLSVELTGVDFAELASR